MGFDPLQFRLDVPFFMFRIDTVGTGFADKRLRACHRFRRFAGFADRTFGFTGGWPGIGESRAIVALSASHLQQMERTDRQCATILGRAARVHGRAAHSEGRVFQKGDTTVGTAAGILQGARQIGVLANVQGDSRRRNPRDAVRCQAAQMRSLRRNAAQRWQKAYR